MIVCASIFVAAGRSRRSRCRPSCQTNSPPRRRASGRKLQTIFRRDLPWLEKLRLIWPKLALISCWADAGAGGYYEALQSLLPTVEIQPKGLLATEGCVSLPLLGRPGAALALRSHFFEFQPVDAPHDIRLAHELEPGGRYRVILTTGGGLYRYELRDEVEVVGFANRCPLLRFLGKSDCIGDLVGEKLSEPHVRAVLHGLFQRHPCSHRLPCWCRSTRGRNRIIACTCRPRPSRTRRRWWRALAAGLSAAW